MTNTPLHSAFFNAAQDSDIDQLSALLAKYPEAIHWTEGDDNALTAAIIAASKKMRSMSFDIDGCLATLQVLIDAGINLDWQANTLKKTALHHVMNIEYLGYRDEMLILLVRHGARTDLKDTDYTVDQMAAGYSDGDGGEAAIEEGERLAKETAARRTVPTLAAGPLTVPDLNARLLADPRRKKFVLRGPA